MKKTSAKFLSTAIGLKHYCISSCLIFLVFCMALTWSTVGCVHELVKPSPFVARPQPAAGTGETSGGAQGGQTSPSQQVAGQQAIPVLELEKQLIDFQRTLYQAAKDNAECLQNQADHHQKFLEWIYGLLAAVMGLVVALCGGVLTFFKYRSRETIEEVVNAQIVSITAAEIKKAMPAIDAEMGGAIKKSRDAIEQELEDFKQHSETKRQQLESDFKGVKDQFSGDIHNITTLATALARACALLSLPPTNNVKENANNDQEREDTIRRLKKIQTDWAPTNRTIAVFIGRLFRMLKKYKTAVEYLDGIIKERDKRGENQGEYIEDYAVLIYNKACYYNLWAITEKEKDESESRESHRQMAWTAVTQAIHLWPDLFESAINDDDFEGLTNHQRAWKPLQP